jgi:hypothetical protein
MKPQPRLIEWANNRWAIKWYHRFLAQKCHYDYTGPPSWTRGPLRAIFDSPEEAKAVAERLGITLSTTERILGHDDRPTKACPQIPTGPLA